MRKTLWTLNIDNYAPELCELTYPLLLAYAQKIGADFQIINERRFPEMPVVYEKLQIFYLGRGNDWNVYIDSDAVIFPDMFDVTERLSKDTVAHYGRDHYGNRFRGNSYSRRDGRDIGSANWFTVASDWCIDLWHPLQPFNENMVSLPEALDAIRPIVLERQAGIDREHLIDDYVLSQNIARYGLKFTTVQDLMKASNDVAVYTWHTHRKTVTGKINEIREGLSGLKIDWLEKKTSNQWLLDYAVNR
jgi:hypothetical protein